MVLMESYFFCASVRLGVLVICFVAALKSTIIMWLIFTNGTAFLFSIIRIFESHYKTSAIVHDSANWIEQYPKELMMFFQLYNFCHIVTCTVAAYGAYKLKKYHVIPLAIFEFLYTVQVVVLVIISLRIARHIVPLATLILLTLGLTFYAMLVAYDTLALIAFIEIMFLVWSERYQRLYGADPLNPVLMDRSLKGMPDNPSPVLQQPIIIYVMPKVGQKLWDMQPQKWWKNEIIQKEIEEKEDSSDYFQREELLSKVLLRNAINGKHLKV
ncbi:uncharacterized protein [Drosophila kikkawai]|uniref:Uncharacterized protein n=1 Tax=Drosophila kikkawai TaxID=30033 RepID=A0A6P4IE28_DROKI|nr:uncharacterized protein LOC108073602 [Drosophila kikkawai]